MRKTKLKTEQDALERFFEKAVGLCIKWHRKAAALFLAICSRLSRWFSRITWSGRLGFMSALAAGLLLNFSVYGVKPFITFAELTPEQVEALEAAKSFMTIDLFRGFTSLIAVILFLAVVLIYWRNRVTYFLIKLGSAGFLFSWCMFLFFAFGIPGDLISMSREDFDNVLRNKIWFETLWFWMPVFVIALVFAVSAMLSSVKRYYTRQDEPVEGEPVALGDKIVESLKTGGNDPAFRRSLSWSSFYHFFILLVIPLMAGKSCYYDSYEIPKGDGAVQTIVQVVKPPKKKKQQYVLNPNSPIIFKVPELDDKRSEEIEQQTENAYKPQIGPPTNKKNAKGGWPNGMESGKIRFIRLEYAGGDWDHNMGKSADYNMLIKMKEYGGFNIAESTESIKIGDLARWKKGKSPPFVYMSGTGNISLNQTEVQHLRKYLIQDGGLLFVDNGGGSFNSSFRNAMRRILPEFQLVDISNDDIIYQSPFFFPNGAPPLWHHSGTRALGIKNNGRWIVFYHQGDMGDAWRTGGSGVSAEVQERSYKMGANIIAYAFTQYLAQVFEDDLMNTSPVKKKKK